MFFGKVLGNDRIIVRILNCCLLLIVFILIIIINVLLMLGMFLLIWKIVEVILIFK